MLSLASGTKLTICVINIVIIDIKTNRFHTTALCEEEEELTKSNVSNEHDVGNTIAD